MKRLLSIATLFPNTHQPRFGTFVARQMEALAARGDWDVTVINPIGIPPFAFGRYAALSHISCSGILGDVSVHQPRFTLIPAIGGPINPMMIARTVMPLAVRLHGQAPFDLVDAQFFYPDGPAAAAVARRLGLPLAIKARGADVHYWGAKNYARRQILRATGQAAGLLAVSAILADDLAALGVARDRVTVHYTGLDRAVFRPLDRRDSRTRLRDHFGISLPDEAPILATVGALIPRKGQIYVLRALALLPDTHLLLAGEGPDRTMLAKFAADHRMTERVHFLGSLDNAMLPSVLSAADAMVLPSASEGLANAWVEALACGTPLVITAAGSASELVTGPEAGRIVARNAEPIAAGIRELLAALPSREATAACVARFSWEANAEALAAYYDGLAAPAA